MVTIYGLRRLEFTPTITLLGTNIDIYYLQAHIYMKLENPVIDNYGACWATDTGMIEKKYFFFFIY